MEKDLDVIYVELEVVAVYDEEKPWMQGKLDIAINGDNPYTWNDVVDEGLFFESLEKDGEYFIFTCNCGMPDCGGWEKGIEVSTKENIVQWIDGKSGNTWRFDKTHILKQVTDLKKEVHFFKKYFKEKGIDYVGVGYSWTEEK